MSFFIPLDQITKSKKQLIHESLLYQVFLPQISNTKDRNKIFNFFKNEEYLESLFKKNKTIAQLSPDFGCDFESSIKYTSKDGKKEHIEFIQNLTPEKLAVMTPFVRFYLVPNKALGNPDQVKSSAIPISFSKEFDTDFYLKRGSRGSAGERIQNAVASVIPGQETSTNSISRGETAAIKSVSLARSYNNTGPTDPYSINVEFYFSSFNVFAYKPAVEKQFLTGIGYDGLARFGLGLSNLKYPSLIKLDQGDFTLVLHYGYNVDKTVSESIFSFTDRSIIERFEQKYIAISPYQNNITFDDRGGMTLSVVYQPSADNALSDTVNFKAKYFESQRMLSLVAKELNDEEKRYAKNLKALEEKLAKELRKSEVKKIKQEISKIKTAIIKKPVFRFSQLLKTHLKKNKQVNKIFISTDFSNKGLDKKYTVKLELEDGRKNKQTINETYVLKDIKTVIQGIKDTKKDKDPLILKNDKVLEEMVDKLLPKTQTTIRFVFLRDFITSIFELYEDEKRKMPPIIFGNFPMTLPNGKKYWCNIGDIPIKLERINAAFMSYFKQSSGGNIRIFIEYFLLDVLPQLLSDDKIKNSIPTLSFSYWNFDGQKWASDNSSGKLAAKLYLANNSKKLIEFSKNYLDDTSLSSAKQCMYLGPIPTVTNQDSKLFLGNEVDIASDSFFKNNTALLNAGVIKAMIGNAKGVVQTLTFSSTTSDLFNNVLSTIKNQDGELTSVLAASVSNYSCNIQIHGTTAIDFPAKVYIPAATIGYSPSYSGDVNRGAIFQDFELGGLYQITNATDNINLETMQYTKAITGFNILRESDAARQDRKDIVNSDKKKILVPDNAPKFNIYNYLYDLNEDYENAFYKSTPPTSVPVAPRLRSVTSAGATPPGSTPTSTPAPPPGGLFGRLAGGFTSVIPEGGGE